MENLLKILLSYFFKVFSRISPHLTAKIAWSFFCKPRIRKKPLSKVENNIKQRAKHYFINSEHYKIAVYEWSNSDRPAPEKIVVLTHGWGGHALNFSSIITKLLESGFKVIAYDSPAHGMSSGNTTNLLHNTRALACVCEHVPQVSALIGHSFGAMASAYLLELNKDFEKFSNVEKIILIAGPNKLSDIFASFTQAMGLPNSVLKIFHQKLSNIAKRNIESMATVNFLQNYKGSTLVIHDQNDHIVPFIEAETISKEVLSSALLVTSGFGHFRILSAIDTINGIFDFISDANITNNR